MDKPARKKRQRPLSWRQSSSGLGMLSLTCIMSLTFISSRCIMVCTAYTVTPTRVRRTMSHKSANVETLVTQSQDATDFETDSWFGDDPSAPVGLPPWLSRFEEEGQTDEHGHVSRRVEGLEYALLEQDFSPRDIRDILQTMKTASSGNVNMFVGMIEFCHLLLQLEEPSSEKHVFVTQEVLLASILHYGDCVTARQTGVYELVKQACQHCTIPLEERLLPPQARLQEQCEEQSMDMESLERTDGGETLNSDSPPPLTLQDVDFAISEETSTAAQTRPWLSSELEAELGEEVICIAKGAARIKQVEILAHAVLGEGRTPSLEQASRLRSLLLSVMDDWRALAIRSAASLFRLEGIFSSNRGTAEYLERTPQAIQTARDALRIYAPLAQRLGMRRLKSRLEALAFRILYRRQYQAVSALYRQSGASWGAKEAMQSISKYLTQHITQVLQSDQKLTGELEDLKVSARVKEPFSLWKKLLKSRKKMKKSQNSRSVPQLEASSSLDTPDSSVIPSPQELSVLEVLDAVALRIVLKARKWSPDEPDNVTRDRERLLCYYTQKLIRDYWPATDERRVKDYIQDPKPNGYQSLHHTSSISCFGEDWPFEVQVRSEEMHQVAEYGVAAHWDYKLKGGKTVAQLPPAKGAPEYALSTPAASEADSPTLVEEVVTVVLDNEEERKTAFDDDESSAQEIESYIDAIVTARENLLETRVFVFLAGSSMVSEEGQILSFQAGAKVVDVIVELETQLGQKLSEEDSSDVPQVFRNGRLTQPDDTIETGDLLLVNL